MNWGFGGFQAPRRNMVFESQYCCSSTAVAGKIVDEGDKIYLPPSALDKLARMHVEYPMLFEVTNHAIGKTTHCGVLEFSADEGWTYMPFWMMQNLMVDEGHLITVKNVSLPKATFVKFRAQSVDFLEVSNARALLEVALRKFTCLTEGDTICIPHVNGRKFYLDVRQVLPEGRASIIETDCNVDFEEPLGYKDSKYAQYEKAAAEKAQSNAGSVINGGSERILQKAKLDNGDDDSSKKFNAFAGSAKRIDGKSINSVASTNATASKQPESKGPTVAPAAAPSYQSQIGSKFSKKKVAVSAFTGTAHKLN